MPQVTPGEPSGTILRSGLAVAAIGIFYTFLDSFLFALGGPRPWVWVIAFAGVAALLCVVDVQRPLAFLRAPFTAWILFYFLLTTAWALFSRSLHLPDVTQTLYDRYRSIVALIALTILFDDRRAARAAVAAVTAGVVLASLLNVAEFLNLIRFETGPERYIGRSSGLFFNPNESGTAIALGVALVADKLPRAWRMPLLFVAAFGVAPTFSRGAMVCLGIVFLWLLFRGALGTWYLAVGALGIVFLAIYAVHFAGSHDLLNDNTAARLHLSKDDSGRLELAVKAWNLFLESPLTGRGLGSTIIWDTDQRAHNMFVTLAADHGILGLLAYPAMGLALVLRNRGTTCFALVLMAAGVFSHSMLEDRYALVLSALAAAGALPATSPARPLVVPDRAVAEG